MTLSTSRCLRSATPWLREQRAARSSRPRVSATSTRPSPVRSWPATRALDATPEVINSDAYGAGWMVEVRPASRVRDRRAADRCRLPRTGGEGVGRDRMTCPNCGHESASDDRFCGACGVPLTAEAFESLEHTGSITSIISPGPGPGTGTGSGPMSAVGSGRQFELPSGSALLVVHRGPGEGQEYVLEEGAGVLTVGRSPEAAIFLDDVTVSRHHAEFRHGAEGSSVRDVGSLNGTYVNRVRVGGPPPQRWRRSADRQVPLRLPARARLDDMTGGVSGAAQPLVTGTISIGEVLRC